MKRPPENSAKTARRGNPEKLIPHRWQPGQSGNPGGRPASAPLSQACREILSHAVPDDPENRTYAQKIAVKLAELAANGDIRAAQELGDRAEGRARQAIEIENARLRDAFDRMSQKELEAYAVSGALPGWFPKDGSNAERQI